MNKQNVIKDINLAVKTITAGTNVVFKQTGSDGTFLNPNNIENLLLAKNANIKFNHDIKVSFNKLNIINDDDPLKFKYEILSKLKKVISSTKVDKKLKIDIDSFFPWTNDIEFKSMAYDFIKLYSPAFDSLNNKVERMSEFNFKNAISEIIFENQMELFKELEDVKNKIEMYIDQELLNIQNSLNSRFDLKIKIEGFITKNVPFNLSELVLPKDDSEQDKFVSFGINDPYEVMKTTEDKINSYINSIFNENINSIIKNISATDLNYKPNIKLKLDLDEFIFDNILGYVNIKLDNLSLSKFHNELLEKEILDLFNSKIKDLKIKFDTRIDNDIKSILNHDPDRINEAKHNLSQTLEIENIRFSV